jgi:hypothetical protein
MKRKINECFVVIEGKKRRSPNPISKINDELCDLPSIAEAMFEYW